MAQTHIAESNSNNETKDLTMVTDDPIGKDLSMNHVPVNKSTTSFNVKPLQDLHYNLRILYSKKGEVFQNFG